MDRNPNDRNTCDICQQLFSSDQELQTHKNDVHGQGKSGDRQSNYDIEQDQTQERKIA
jgi:hypothetical protein